MEAQLSGFLLRVKEHDGAVPGASAWCRAAHLSVCPSASTERFSVTDRLSVESDAYTPPWLPSPPNQRSVGGGYAPNQLQLNWVWEGSCAGAHMHSGCRSGTSRGETSERNRLQEAEHRATSGSIGVLVLWDSGEPSL